MMEPTPSVEHAESQHIGNEDVDEEENDSDGFVHLRNITETHEIFKRYRFMVMFHRIQKRLFAAIIRV